MKNKNIYYAAALSSFILWGFISFCLKPLHIYPSLDILFFRVLFSAVIISMVTFVFRATNLREQKKVFKKLSRAEQNKTVLLTLTGGLVITANWFFYIYVMNHISIKTAAFAYLVCPIVTAVLAALILKEKISKLQKIAILMSAMSCMILGINSSVELTYSLIVAVSYALYLISQRKNTQLDKFVILTFQILFSALLLLPFFPFYCSAIPSAPNFYVLIAILAVLFTIVPLYLNLLALKVIDSSTMGILLYINPILNFSVAIVAFKESTTSLQLIAYCLIFISVLVFNLKAIEKNLKRN